MSWRASSRTKRARRIVESDAEIQRAIENMEVAAGAPVMMQGINNEDIARGIDEHMIRQPLGVVAAITPFNFPRHGADVVFALRRGVWQLLYFEAERESADDDVAASWS